MKTSLLKNLLLLFSVFTIIGCGNQFNEYGVSFKYPSGYNARPINKLRNDALAFIVLPNDSVNRNTLLRIDYYPQHDEDLKLDKESFQSYLSLYYEDVEKIKGPFEKTINGKEAAYTTFLAKITKYSTPKEYLMEIIKIDKSHVILIRLENDKWAELDNLLATIENSLKVDTSFKIDIPPYIESHEADNGISFDHYSNYYVSDVAEDNCYIAIVSNKNDNVISEISLCYYYNSFKIDELTDEDIESLINIGDVSNAKIKSSQYDTINGYKTKITFFDGLYNNTPISGKHYLMEYNNGLASVVEVAESDNYFNELNVFVNSLNLKIEKKLTPFEAAMESVKKNFSEKMKIELEKNLTK